MPREFLSKIVRDLAASLHVLTEAVSMHLVPENETGDTTTRAGYTVAKDIEAFRYFGLSLNCNVRSVQWCYCLSTRRYRCMSMMTSTWHGSLLHATHVRICNLEKDNGEAGFNFLAAALPSHSEWNITDVSAGNATANTYSQSPEMNARRTRKLPRREYGSGLHTALPTLTRLITS